MGASLLPGSCAQHSCKPEGPRAFGKVWPVAHHPWDTKTSGLTQGQQPGPAWLSPEKGQGRAPGMGLPGCPAGEQ